VQGFINFVIVIAFLAAPVLVVYLVFRLARGRITRAVRQGEHQGAADFLATGGKPWGEPIGGTSHGSAYFMSTRQVVEKHYGQHLEKANGKLFNNQMWLGGHSTKTLKNGKATGTEDADLYGPMEGHFVTVAPTRAGKGACHVIPNILNYTVGSLVINDIKGENAAVTEKWRKDVSKGHCFRFAPFEADSCSWNPLDFIRDGDDRWGDAGLIADMLIVKGKGDSFFWDNEARNFLQGAIVHVVESYPEGERNMAKVRQLLTGDKYQFAELVGDMSDSAHELVRRAASTFLRKEDKTQNNVMAALNSQMTIWDDERLRRHMNRSDFRFEDLKEETATIYFFIRPEELESCTPVMRLFFGQALAAMTRNPKKPFAPVTFLIDEFPRLGRMKPIEEGISYLAGYGVRLWLFAQDLGQIKSAYGDMAQSLFANCACRCFFGTSDPETAKLVSDMCGTMTVPVTTFSESAGTGAGFGGKPRNEALSYTSQPLMTPQEVMSMDRREQLVFIRDEQPIKGIKVAYFEKPAFEGLYEEWNPEAAPMAESVETELPESANADTDEPIEVPKEDAIEDGPSERPVESSERKPEAPQPPSFKD